MSRIGRRPVKIEDKVKVTVKGPVVLVEGPKGKLDLTLHPRMKVDVKGNEVIVADPGKDREGKALYGLTRSLIFNQVKGVTAGYTKELDLEGVGFRCASKGKNLELSLGFSHPVEFPIPEGIQVNIVKQTHLTITGIDKQLVGQVAANIRRLYEPEPYKGKGIRYTNEHVRRKQGKKVA